jgi:hypothetical protein
MTSATMVTTQGRGPSSPLRRLAGSRSGAPLRAGSSRRDRSREPGDLSVMRCPPRSPRAQWRRIRRRETYWILCLSATQSCRAPSRVPQGRPRGRRDRGRPEAPSVGVGVVSGRSGRRPALPRCARQRDREPGRRLAHATLYPHWPRCKPGTVRAQSPRGAAWRRPLARDRAPPGRMDGRR